MLRIKNFSVLFLASCLLLVAACKKDKKTGPLAPLLTTTPASDITSTTAISGGTITDDGGETISASGICWSTTSNPTIADDTTKGATVNGSFTAMLKSLTPSTTYYVRAYAINRIGTGYGDVKQFTTGNAAPVAININITGTTEVNKTLTATYMYTDVESDLEGATTFQWYMADNSVGMNEAPINGATELTYTVQEAQQGKYIRIGITPKAVTGTMDGVEEKSVFAGAIGEATTVTFMYAGNEVTYGIINSTTGKKWLDRNLGAGRVAQSINDYQAYGDLFQWGRAADGHQLISRTSEADITGINGITSTDDSNETSADDTPDTPKFIAVLGSPGDWRDPQKDNLWQGVDGINNPCPNGWRIPTADEWAAETMSSGPNAFEKLKLTYTGFRFKNDGSLKSNSFGFYWSSTIKQDMFTPTMYTVEMYFDATSFNAGYTSRANGMVCRCVKN